VTRVFFRQVEIVGSENIPPTGGVLFAGNSTELADRLRSSSSRRAGRKVHFAARTRLFKGRLMRAVLRGPGAVPISGATIAMARRPRDAPAQPVPTPARGSTTSVRVCTRVRGAQPAAAIGIFPEGLSHDDSAVAKLKTGAGAGFALSAAPHRAAAADLDRPRAALTFIHPKRFRSACWSVRPADRDLPQTATDRRCGSRADRRARMARCGPLTINALRDWETVRALVPCAACTSHSESRSVTVVELAGGFNTHYGGRGRPRRASSSLRAPVGATRSSSTTLRIHRPRARSDLSKPRRFAARMMRAPHAARVLASAHGAVHRCRNPPWRSARIAGLASRRKGRHSRPPSS